jgi:hypothetical protein
MQVCILCTAFIIEMLELLPVLVSRLEDTQRVCSGTPRIENRQINATRSSWRDNVRCCTRYSVDLLLLGHIWNRPNSGSTVCVKLSLTEVCSYVTQQEQVIWIAPQPRDNEHCLQLSLPSTCNWRCASRHHMLWNDEATCAKEWSRQSPTVVKGHWRIPMLFCALHFDKDSGAES